MQRWGLRLLLASVVLYGVGYLTGIFSVVVEMVRLAAAVCLTGGLVLLFVNHVRTPDPQGR